MNIKFKHCAAFVVLLISSCGGSEAQINANTSSTVPVSTLTETSLANWSTISLNTTTTQKQDETTSTSLTTTTEQTTTTKLPTTTSLDPTSSSRTTISDNTQIVSIHFESRVGDFSSSDLEQEALDTLNDSRGWTKAGFSFRSDTNSKYKVILAEGSAVDQLCLPLKTYGTVSCQNGNIVALNANRWRSAVDHWDKDLDTYRGYLINHEVGHLIGQRHPTPRCPVNGRPAGVMEQQTASLKGCTGNPWPRDWEIEHAKKRPVVYAPLPAWAPDPVPANGEKP